MTYYHCDKSIYFSRFFDFFGVSAEDLGVLLTLCLLSRVLWLVEQVRPFPDFCGKYASLFVFVDCFIYLFIVFCTEFLRSELTFY